MSIDGRRSNRLPLQIAIEIAYSSEELDQPRLERTHTLSVDRHGARLCSSSKHAVGSMIHLGVPHLGRSAHCRVVWCSAPMGNGYEVGIEFDSDGDVWGLPFTSGPAALASGQIVVVPVAPAAFAMLVQILLERGILRAGELESRMEQAEAARKQNNWPMGVVV